MTTTALLIEHLLTGVQAGLALVLLAFSFVDPAPLLAAWAASEAVTFIVALALVYPLGVFVDNLAERLLEGFTARIKPATAKAGDGPSVFDLVAPRSNEFLRTFFEGLRTRIRVCRSAVVTFALLTVAGVTFTWSRSETSLTVGVGVLGLASVLLALWSFYRTTSTWKRWRRRTADLFIAASEHPEASPLR